MTQLANKWKKRIQEWQESKKSLALWCKENELVYSQCLYWKMRFLGIKKQKKQKQQNNATPLLSGFMELKQESPESGIIIEAGNLRIRLLNHFDQATLIRFLKALEGGLC